MKPNFERGAGKPQTTEQVAARSSDRIAVLRKIKTELRTGRPLPAVDDLPYTSTSLRRGDGCVFDYSGRKDKSFEVEVLDSEIVNREMKEKFRPSQLDRIKLPLSVRQAINCGDYSSAVKLYGFHGAKARKPNHRKQRASDAGWPSDVELGVRAGKAQVWANSEITKGLRGVRVVSWYRKKRGPGGWPKWTISMGLLCPDYKTALFAFAVLEELRVCPRCEKLFAPMRPDQQYCSVQCRETYRKQRYRAKDAKKAKEGGK